MGYVTFRITTEDLDKAIKAGFEAYYGVHHTWTLESIIECKDSYPRVWLVTFSINSINSIN